MEDPSKDHRMETTNAASVDDDNLPLPDLLNDEGFPVNFGSAVTSYSDFDDEDEDELAAAGMNAFAKRNPVYCGRWLGSRVLPGSGGRCGPTNKPACPSCQRFQRRPDFSLQIFKRLFPALGKAAGVSVSAQSMVDSWICQNIFRPEGNAANFAGAVKRAESVYSLVKVEDRQLVLSNQSSSVPVSSTWIQRDENRQMVERLREIRPWLTASQAEFVLRHGERIGLAQIEGDFMDHAAVLALDMDDVSVEREMIKERKKSLQNVEDALSVNQKRARVIREACVASKWRPPTEAVNFTPLVQSKHKLLEKSTTKTETEASLPLTLVTKDTQHLMVLKVKKEDESNISDDHEESFCVLCACPLPSSFHVMYSCKFCRICEVCVQDQQQQQQSNGSSSSSEKTKNTNATTSPSSGGNGEKNDSTGSGDHISTDADIVTNGEESLFNSAEGFAPVLLRDSDSDSEVDGPLDLLSRLVHFRTVVSMRPRNNAPVLGTKAVFRCPGRANGSHLHQHPLTFKQSPRHICHVKGNGCAPNYALWICDECDFYACQVCMSNPAPAGYNRKLGRIIPENQQQNQEQAMSRTMEDEELHKIFTSPIPLVDREAFDADAAEREAARIWDTSNESLIVKLGGGTVGQNATNTSRENISEEETPVNFDDEDDDVYSSDNDEEDDRSRLLPTPLLASEGFLRSDAVNAFDLFRARSDASTTTAIDEVQVEDLLLRAEAADARLTRRSIHDAISEGRLGLAGILLLSQAYAPVPLSTKQQTGAESTANDAGYQYCWCGDIIDRRTAPDGAVGCLGGHAMHASCAADLLLGGGQCPTCRQPIFYSKVDGAEANAAIEFAKAEIKRVQRAERQKIKQNLEESGEDPSFEVGDVVLVLSDVETCKQAQLADPIYGGWEEDMSMGCGLAGRVIETTKDVDRSAVRVRSMGHHVLRAIEDDEHSKCPTCDYSVPSRYTGEMVCRLCLNCVTCCRRTLGSCEQVSQEWTWNASVLTLMRRSGGVGLGHETVFKDKVSADRAKTERHILRLRGELVAVKKAREKVKEETEHLVAGLGQQRVTREFSQGSADALRRVADSGVSAADCQRARHLLLLARQWGDSKEAIEKRRSLYGCVQNGDSDSAGRIVRGYNARKFLETAMWADATRKNPEYVVEQFAQADLRAFPDIAAPRTGFTLESGSKFRCKSECLDKNGSLWLQVDSAPSSNWSSESAHSFSRGWLCVRPGATGSRAMVSMADTELSCCACGDRLFSSAASLGLYKTAEGQKVAIGDRLLVAATLERVTVREVKDGYIICSFDAPTDFEPKDFIRSSVCDAGGNEIASPLDCSVFYAPNDLIFRDIETEGLDHESESWARRELFIRCKGDQASARKMWKEAKQKEGRFNTEDFSLGFASCARGHPCHARCFQAALLAGQTCPADGCLEPLWVPSVTRVNNDDEDACHGETASARAEAAAPAAASELAGHDALVNERVASSGAATSEEWSGAGFRELKMCPLCCTGPIFNQDCDDMSAHHGDCAVAVLGRQEATHCLPNGRIFRVSASEIAARVTGISATKSVIDVLPRCDKHNCVVMFNGCTGCGHLFTDIHSHHMPDWDPTARATLEVNKKARNAVRLLTEQVRKEAAMLQFERDALKDAGGGEVDGAKGWGGASIDDLANGGIPPRKRPREDDPIEELSGRTTSTCDAREKIACFYSHPFETDGSNCSRGRVGSHFVI